MNIKFIKKIVIISVILAIYVNLFGVKIVNAQSIFSEGMEYANSFIERGQDSSVIDYKQFHIQSIFNFVYTIAYICIFIMGGVLGMKFLMGSLEEKAKIKEVMVPYIIGVLVITASFVIWKVAVLIISGITK